MRRLCMVLFTALFLQVLKPVDSTIELQWHDLFHLKGISDTSTITPDIADNKHVRPVEDQHGVLGFKFVNTTTGNLLEHTGGVSITNLMETEYADVQSGNPKNVSDGFPGKFCVHDLWDVKSYARWRRQIPYFKFCKPRFSYETETKIPDEYFFMYRGEFFMRNWMLIDGEPTDEKHLIRISVNYQNQSYDFDTPWFRTLNSSYSPDTIKVVDSVGNLTVTANNPFTVKLETVNKYGERITEGINSKMELMTSVSYIHKIFYSEGGPWLAHTDQVLGGNAIVTNRNDKAVFQYFNKGEANVTLQLEDVMDQCHVNFTMKKPFYHYRRYPEDEFHIGYNLWASYYYFERSKYIVNTTATNSTHIVYQYPNFYGWEDSAYFRATRIMNVTVVAQTPHTLRITPDSSIHTTQYANFEIVGTLKIELLDVNGYRVTSGPDSELTVTTHSDVGATCLSVESTFKLHRGIASFPGSICRKMDEQTHLYFKVTSSAGILQTAKTISFSVSYYGNVLAAISDDFPIAEKMVGSAIKYGMEHSDYWFGRKYVIEKVVKSPQELMSKLELAKSGAEPGVLGFVGPNEGDETSQYAAIAEGYNIPYVSNSEISMVYSDKSKYPMFARVTFNKHYNYLTMANFLKSRKWNKIVVICTFSEPPAAEFLSATDTFGISVELAHFPAVSDNITVLSQQAIAAFFKDLDGIGRKVFVPMLSKHSLQYFVAEVSKRNYTGNYGYTWVGEKQMMDGFPYNNEGYCSSVTGTTCVDAFKGAFVLKPHYPLYGQTTMNWAHLKENYGFRYSEPFPLTNADEDTLVKAALYYDATITLLYPFAKVFNELRTLNKDKFMESLRTLDHNLLLTSYEQLLLDSNGDRMNYTAYLMQFDGITGATGKENIIKKKRFLHLGDYVTPANITSSNIMKEVIYEGATTFYATFPDDQMNTVSIQSTVGEMNGDLKMTLGYMTPLTRSEKVPPSFSCPGGCGGQQLNAGDQHEWEQGTCIKQGLCSCKIDPSTNLPGYWGKKCEKAVCDSCLHGTCTSPNNCTCNEGYINSANKSDCGVPTCLTYGCNLNNGVCQSADFCKCNSNFYGKDCTKQCDCKNGKCSDGESGSGACTCDSGYIGSKCDTSVITIAVPTVIGVLFILIVFGLLARYKYKQVQIMAQLMSTDWKADWDSIKLKQARQKSSMKSLMSMISMMSTTSGKKGEDKLVCKNQGQWNGRDVVVKLLDKDDVELNDDIRWEIKQMRDVKHPNLCLFVGACIDQSHVAILNEVCGKGSLEDILSNDDIDLGWDFRYSMLKDICRGMQYLISSEIGSHGRLKSSNCLVDNRWTVKLSDYGLKTFKSDQRGIKKFVPADGDVELPMPDELDKCDYYNLLWTAPEIVAMGVTHPNHVAYGTPVADIYSFAIIMVEMCTRHHPYHELDFLGPHEIVQMVGRLINYDKRVTLVECKDSDNVSLSCLRPQITRDELPKEDNQANGLYELIQKCWNQDLSCRPTFAKCMSFLNKICPHRGELMDNLIVLMEQYTNSLEAIVAERTCELREEKEKSDVLLSKMLPPLIAEELKSGNNPKPEYFNFVTIYFSDVVGFGKICAEATPYEVVELLNDLYSVMDDVIDSFDCYKVETIADCYVVASGLPVRNGDAHAGEIASMALQLLSSFNGVGYKHLPNSQVQLRIGMHSGPIVAGVVGLKMPRYCLFGDTMNTASRMESGGFALKIHLSQDTYKILQKIGGYNFICRGERQVKGRGLMTTYWLTGKDGHDYNLPSEDLALSASQHDFK